MSQESWVRIPPLTHLVVNAMKKRPFTIITFSGASLLLILLVIMSTYISAQWILSAEEVGFIDILLTAVAVLVSITIAGLIGVWFNGE